MWCFTLLLLVGAVVANPGHEHAWETGKQYQYLVRSRTLSALDKFNDQFSGILIRATLNIQPVTSDRLQAKLTSPEFARIHTQVPGGLDVQMSDQQLQYQELPLTGKPFEIVVKHGMIRDLMVPKDISTWELNLLKGIVSQLQVDTQGENVLFDRNTQEPRDGQSFASFRTMEDTVGGKCEVLYDISPLSWNDLYNTPELAPMLRDKHNEDQVQLIDVRKTKNYDNCKQQRGFHLGVRMSLTQGSNVEDRMIRRSSSSRVVPPGDLKRFTIQSAVTTHNVFVKNEQPNSFLGFVDSKISLTLVNLMNKVANEIPINRDNLVSTGNLLYTYNNPLTEIEQGVQHHQTISRNSQEIVSSESSSGGSSENQSGGGHILQQKGGNSGNSATSSSEEFQHVQALPSLNEAPKFMTPFSLAFQDDRTKLNLLQEATTHVKQIVQDLQQSNNVVEQGTLQKFANLVNLLRSMNENQMSELEQTVLKSNEQPNENTMNYAVEDTWSVLRDSVGQVGTGPALLTIIRWVENGKLKGVEGARIIAKIPTSARLPSENYIETVFEKLVTNPKVQQMEHVNKLAPISFAKLVHIAQIDKKHSQNAYPIYNFGKLNPKTDKAVTEIYMPYMEKQLNKYLLNGDSEQAQTYIIALSTFGHPKVLRVFEPYLEGQQKVSTYLRTLMVSSLNSLLKGFPKVVRPVAYKIYLNEQESPEVRVAAVHLYLLTDPPLVSMLRMARYTRYDNSLEVNAAVKSSIIGLSEWNDPDFYHLSQKARLAKRLLTPKRFSMLSSRGIFMNAGVIQTIGSKDSNIPKKVYLNTQNTFFMKLAKSVMKAEYGVSSVSRLINIFNKPTGHQQYQQTALFDNLRQSLGMQAKTVDQVEGNILVSSIVGTYFYPFDQQRLEKLATSLQKNLEENYHLHINHMEVYDETVSFPLESGLPITHSVVIPTLLRISMQSKGNGQKGENSNKNANGVFNVIVAIKDQRRFGIVSSHDHQQYLAGLDKNILVHLPVEYNVNLKSQKPFHSLQLKMHVDPAEQRLPLRLMYRDVVPLTGQIDMSKLSQLSTQNLIPVNAKKQKRTIRLGTLQVVMEGDNEMDTTPKNILQWLLSLSDDSSFNYKKVEISHTGKSNNEHNDGNLLTFAYDELNNKSNSNNNGQGVLNDDINVVDKQANSPKRRQQFLEKVSNGIKSPKAYVYDTALVTPILQNSQVVTVSVGYSDVEQKSQYLLYWNQQTPSGEIVYETLIAGVMESTQNNFLSYDKAIHQVPKDRFVVNILSGQNYKEAEKIQLKGKLTRSDNLSEMLMKSKTVQECMKEMRFDKGLQVCQKAIRMALKKDLLQMTITMNSDDQNEIANMIVGYISETIPNTNIEIAQNTHLRNQISVEMKISPNVENTKATLQTSQMNVNFQVQNPPENQLWQQDETEDLENEEEQASCTVSKNEVVTFDQKSYPLHMGEIWHVMMIPDQMELPNHSTISWSYSRLVSIMTRQQNNHLQVRVLAGGKNGAVDDREYLLQQLDSSIVEVLINGQKVQLTSHKYEDKENGQTIATLFIQPDGLVNLNLVHHRVLILYNGKIVRVISDSYRNAIRGLCGNYDKQINNDFVTPQNCILQRPEEFTATYALLDDKNNNDIDSLKVIANNKEKASRAACTPLTPRQTNVISAMEAGRSTDKQVWGHHQNTNMNKKIQGNTQFIYRTKVDVSDPEEICFSIRPVLTCPEHTKPTSTKKKTVAMFCMPQSDAAQEIKRRIQQGANPDLSHRSVSKKQVFEVPIACY